MEEVWKDVPGFEGYYLVSNLGRINHINKKKGSNKYANPLGIVDFESKVKSDKEYYKICRDYVHRIVAKVFIPNPENKREVDHIDGNRHNNAVINLRWSTTKENANYPLRRKHISESLKGKHFGYWKGKHLSEETKNKISEIVKERMKDETVKDKMRRPRSEEGKLAIKISNQKRKGIKFKTIIDENNKKHRIPIYIPESYDNYRQSKSYNRNVNDNMDTT